VFGCCVVVWGLGQGEPGTRNERCVWSWTMRRVACIYFPDWCVQHRLASRPSDDSRPLLVVSAAGGRGRRVVACCARATDDGVRRGVSLAEAKAIVSGPPSGGDGAGGESNVGLDVVLADEESDRRALAGEARRAWRFTPLVSLPPSTASARSVVEDARSRPDTVLANITGCGHLFGGESGLALEMQSECLERGYRVRVSVADSPGTAWAIARAAEWADLPWTPLVASEGRDELWMSRLPIEALALQPGVVRSLRELDVVKVDRLLELPVEEIKRRFGDETLWRIDRALGRVQEPLECLPMPDPVMAGHIFEFPVSRSDWLQEGLRELVVEVAAGLQSRGRVAWRLVCRVRSEMASGGTSWTEWVTGLVEPSYEAEHLWELVQLQSQRRRCWCRCVVRWLVMRMWRR
jgi:protein ImuB